MTNINETHDKELRSWIESANDPETDFPIQNLPFCYFDRSDSDISGGVGVAIGDFVVDLSRCREDGLFSDPELKDIAWRVDKG